MPPRYYVAEGDLVPVEQGTDDFGIHSDVVEVVRFADHEAVIERHHVDLCCSACGTHVMPHRGCILR